MKRYKLLTMRRALEHDYQLIRRIPHILESCKVHEMLSKLYVKKDKYIEENFQNKTGKS